METAILPSAFLDEYWRKKPLYLKNRIKANILEQFTPESFLDWCRVTEDSVRLFQIDSKSKDGLGQSALLNNPKDAATLYPLLKKKNEQFTFLMNSVEMADIRIRKLRDDFQIPYILRVDDIIATLSTPDSGIGFHAGHEDGFIVQLYGSRNWKVWSPSLTSNEYRYELLHPTTSKPPMEKPDGNEHLLIDVVTSPGDILYIPPFFPHDGVTIEESLSLNMAWRGLAPISFLKHISSVRHEYIDTLKAITLFEDIQPHRLIPKYWVSDTLNSVHTTNMNPLIEVEANEIISSYIQIQVENYLSNQVTEEENAQ